MAIFQKVFAWVLGRAVGESQKSWLGSLPVKRRNVMDGHMDTPARWRAQPGQSGHLATAAGIPDIAQAKVERQGGGTVSWADRGASERSGGADLGAFQ